MGWWLFTRSAIEALTEPADVAGCDRAIDELSRESRIAAWLHAASRTVRSAWSGSFARRVAGGIGTALTPDDGPKMLRVRGWIAVASGLTILGLNAMKPVPVARFTALVPLAIVIAGAFVMACAAPLARAAADRRRVSEMREVRSR